MLSITFIFHGFVFAFRSIMIFTGTSVTQFYAPTAFNLIQYFDAFSVGLIWTFGFIMMLTQRLKTEISEAKLHFEEIFTTSPDAVAINRLSDGYYVNWNEGYLKISGFSTEDLKGKSSLDINIWVDKSTREKAISLIQEQGYLDNHEIRFKRKTGEILTGLMSAKLITLNDDQHIISVTRDISDRKKAEEELTLKSKELQKLNAEKDKFFSIITHDLKSPFNSIVGFSELLIEKANNKDLDGVKDFANVILQSSNRVMALLMNLMEWSRTQTGKIKYQPEVLELYKLIAENVLLFNNIALQKNITIINDKDTNITVLADKDMVGTILRNLISNAIKFTYPGGRITISTSKTDKEVIVSISDTGIGITKEGIKKIFRIDENYTTSGTLNESGTGLGLILCKEFVDKQGGKIWVESEPGKGSAFSFSLKNSPGIKVNNQ